MPTRLRTADVLLRGLAHTALKQGKEPDMRAATTSVGRRMVDYVRDTWDELEYAQRRLVEVQTGTDEQLAQWRARARVEELENHYALDSTDVEN